MTHILCTISTHYKLLAAVVLWYQFLWLRTAGLADCSAIYHFQRQLVDNCQWFLHKAIGFDVIQRNVYTYTNNECVRVFVQMCRTMRQKNTHIRQTLIHSDYVYITALKEMLNFFIHNFYSFIRRQFWLLALSSNSDFQLNVVYNGNQSQYCSKLYCLQATK